MKKASVTISSPSESPNILVSELSGSSRNLIGVTPSEGDLWDWGGYEPAILAIFLPITHRISEMVQDRTNVTIDH